VPLELLTLVQKRNSGVVFGSSERRDSMAQASNRRFRGLLAPITATALVAGLLSAGPAAAHTFTRTDGDDTRGLLDLRSASVAHTSTAVVHSFRTFAGWAPRDLGRNSSGFIIGIDKDNNASQAERCAVVFFARRLRATLINCITGGAIKALPVSKPNRTTVKVPIPKTQTGLVYRWAVVSLYFEKKPCLNGCVDGIPNLSGFILHDLKPPTVSMTTTPLRTWEISSTTDFEFPFEVFDDHAGIATWRVERRLFETSTWTVVASGTGGGPKSPLITGVAGHAFYRVVATDKHGNVKVGPSRRVYTPRDDRDLAPQGTFNDPTPVQVPDSGAFQGTLTFLGLGESLDYAYTHTAGPCRPIELIGLGGGDWTVDASVNGAPHATIDGTTFAGNRQILFSYDACDSTTFEFTVTEANFEFPVDGIVAKAA